MSSHEQRYEFER